MTYREQSIVGRPLQIVVGFVFSLVACILIWQVYKRDTFSLSSIDEVKIQFSRIRLPSDSRQLTEVKVSNKITIQSVYSRYSVELGASEIEKFFSAQLEPLGWKTVEKSKPTPGKVLVRYCKSGMTVVVETSSKEISGSNFFLGVSRGNQPINGWSCS